MVFPPSPRSARRLIQVGTADSWVMCVGLRRNVPDFDCGGAGMGWSVITDARIERDRAALLSDIVFPCSCPSGSIRNVLLTHRFSRRGFVFMGTDGHR